MYNYELEIERLDIMWDTRVPLDPALRRRSA